jgi:hypothetical protein
VARTPVSEIVATIDEVKRIQGQVAGLIDAIERLALRVETIERRLPPGLSAPPPPPPPPPPDGGQ